MAGEWTYLEKVPILRGYEEISVERRLYGGAACPITFVDASSGQVKELKFSENAPRWRLVNKGLNIFGICTNFKCEAYKKEVVVMINKKKFDLIKERNELFCPECGSLIIPKTVGFYLCKYKKFLNFIFLIIK